jgi:hypothetical protein
VYSRHLDHAEEELNGPWPPSSRFRLIQNFTIKHEHGPKTLAFRFFGLEFFNHLGPLYHAEKEMYGPGSP